MSTIIKRLDQDDSRTSALDDQAYYYSVYFTDPKPTVSEAGVSAYLPKKELMSTFNWDIVVEILDALRDGGYREYRLRRINVELTRRWLAIELNQPTLTRRDVLDTRNVVPYRDLREYTEGVKQYLGSIGEIEIPRMFFYDTPRRPDGSPEMATYRQEVLFTDKRSGLARKSNARTQNPLAVDLYTLNTYVSNGIATSKSNGEFLIDFSSLFFNR